MRIQRFSARNLYAVLIACCAMLFLTRSAAAQVFMCYGIIQFNGPWTIRVCPPQDPNFPDTMYTNLFPSVRAEYVSVSYRYETATIYANGTVNVKGGSFILGPSYWADDFTYYGNPKISRLDMDLRGLSESPIYMTASATNHAFAISYNFSFGPQTDSRTRLHVTQTYTATAPISIPPNRTAEKQGLKLVQASSRFIQGNPCISTPPTDCNDSDTARFIGNDLERHQVAFANLTAPAFILNPPLPLGSTWLDALATEHPYSQSQRPSIRVALDALPTDHAITAQGWITGTTGTNDDNVGLWLNNDDTAAQTWSPGQSARDSYWLLAQDNPPEPWGDLGLRDGTTLLNFEGAYNCYPVRDVGQATSASVRPIAGYTDTALQLDYNLNTSNYNWAQVRCDFSPPLDLSAFDHLRFDWRGEPASGNSIQVGLITRDGTGDHIFARGYHHATQRGWWGQLDVPFQFLDAWTAGTTLNPAQVVAFFVSVVKDQVDDTGGTGHMAIDDLNVHNVAGRTVPASFEPTVPITLTSQAAANWIAAQQKPNGLVKSWKQETACNSYTYDQALALIVLAKEKRWSAADALVNALARTQNTDGSWNQDHDCNTMAASGAKWEGDMAWAVHALSRYRTLGGANPTAGPAQVKGANFLRTRVGADGCLVIDHTEGTLDAWFAFRNSGADYAADATKIKNCLLNYYWDDGMGRFKGGRNSWQPYLDNQTWGAAFLHGIGEDVKARRALSYARRTLILPAQGDQVFGVDGQGGPWSVWNEGVGQYAAVGGQGAQDFVRELLAQQQADGGVPASPDDFAGAGVWTTRWQGIAPTAWLYFALTGEPFIFAEPPTIPFNYIWLPLIRK